MPMILVSRRLISYLSLIYGFNEYLRVWKKKNKGWEEAYIHTDSEGDQKHMKRPRYPGRNVFSVDEYVYFQNNPPGPWKMYDPNYPSRNAPMSGCIVITKN